MNERVPEGQTVNQTYYLKDFNKPSLIEFGSVYLKLLPFENCYLQSYSFKAAYSLTNKRFEQTEQTEHARTNRMKKYFARLTRLLYSANSQMFVPFVIFHFPT